MNSIPAVSTPFTRLVGCAVPIQLAPMAGPVGPGLVAAVARAGGHSLFPSVLVSQPALEAAIDRLRADTGVFGVNFIVPLMDEACLELAANRAPMVDLFLGDPDRRTVARVHAGGALASWQVGSLEEALAAAEAGCDVVVLPGTEAGGRIRGELELLRLLDSVTGRLEVPVLAAGGIATAGDVRRAMEAGADGVRVGTRFIVAEESMAHPAWQLAVVEAEPGDTVITRSFAVGVPDIPHRVMRRSLQGAAGADPAAPVGSQIKPDGHRMELPRFAPDSPTRSFRGQIEATPFYAGQSSERVHRVQPAGEIVADLSAGLPPGRRRSKWRPRRGPRIGGMKTTVSGRTILTLLAAAAAVLAAGPAASAQTASGPRTLSLLSGPAMCGFDTAGELQFDSATPDGSTVLLEVADPLRPEDTDEETDAYACNGGLTSLVSAPGAGATAGSEGSSRAVAISADGARVFFTSEERLVGADSNDSRDLYERVGGQTLLVSAHATTGAASGGVETPVLISRDGTHVVFRATRPLVSSDNDTLLDVYERHGGVTRLVSAPGAGAAGPGGFALLHAVSEDGSRVIFESFERLVAADVDAALDLYERSGDTTTLLTTAAAGSGGFRGASADATHVYFTSEAKLVTTDDDALPDVYESFGGAVRLVSAPAPGGADGHDPATFEAASRDGSRVFFSTGERLVPEDADARIDVYQRAAGATTLVSAGATGPPDDASFEAVSTDGSQVFFTTAQKFVAEDTDTEDDVYRRAAGVTTLVSVPGAGGDPTAPVSLEGVSDDGSRVYLRSSGSFAGEPPDGSSDLYERADGQTTLISGEGSREFPGFAGLSSDGRIAFLETDESLTPDDQDQAKDVYAWGAPPPPKPTPPVGDPGAGGQTFLAGRATIAGRVLRLDRRGRLRLRLQCHGPGACAGTISITSARRVRGRILKLVSGRGFALAAGEARTLTIRVPRRVAAKVRRARRLRVRVVLRAPVASRRTLTIRSARRR